MGKRLPNKKLLKSPINRSERGDFFLTKDTSIILSDGKSFSGQSPSDQIGEVIGEAVFNTGMSGYVESLTDPSYSGQILVFTYPLIGNYGVNLASVESDKIQVRGVVTGELALNWSHGAADQSLLEWLKSQNIPVIFGVDTRALTKHLRSNGTMMGKIGENPTKPKSTQEPVFVSIGQPKIYNENNTKKVILVDCGSKENIARKLCELPITVKRVPYDYDYSKEDFDGIVISNGPGDPEDYTATVEILKKVMAKNKPIFGICLGNQILGLAAGAKTYKLPFGHRGHNQPCQQTETKNSFITSQNHGYAISAKSLPKDWIVSYINLNDGSVEGIKHKTKPFSSVQFHPEASPGPTDTAWMFEEFYKTL